MSATLLALAAAANLAVASVFTKRMVDQYPPRQLIGPLLGLNALLVLPFAGFVVWHWSTQIALLHVASAACLVLTSWCIFDLFTHGSAAAVSVSQALAPIPAVAFSVALVSATVGWPQAVGAVVVSLAVVASLGGAFGGLGRVRALLTVIASAALSGLLIVLTKLLTDRGPGVAEIYFARTALAAPVWLLLAPPRGLPVRAVPSLFTRSSFQTAYFVLLILAVERGSPAAVQTLAATTPLMIVLGTACVRRRRPQPRLVAASFAVIIGVALTTA